jgi:hypothetical protein
MDDRGHMAVLTDAREQAIRDLTRHCGDGRLTLDELEDRIDEVNRATTDEEILHALRELPVTTREPVAAEAADEPELVVPDVVLPPRKGHGGACAPRRRAGEASSLERTLRAVWVIGGFIALFNGLLWLALVLWIVVPKLVLPNLRRI